MRHQSRLALAALVCAFAHAAAQDTTTLGSTLSLVPRPRELTEVEVVALRNGVTIDLPANSDDRFAATDLTNALRARGIAVSNAAGVGSVRVSFLRTAGTTAKNVLTREKLVFTDTMSTEGYVIVPGAKRLIVIGATSAGVFYGAQTVKQLVEGDGATARIHLARIRDWPAMRYRGLHDDLSRGPVPTLEFQKRQIRTFAAYKLNVYSPYFEHTLAYASHPLPAPPDGALSRADIRELVSYARQYHIDVIPEQEAFGHLHHMLKWELYAPLAETPHGHVLAPGQSGSMKIIRDLFAEIDSLFPSRFIHLGADETFELGRGQTAERVKSEGIGAVYVNFLKEIADSLRYTGKRFLFWGDVAQNHPELVRTLPQDMIPVAWWYSPMQSFDRLITPFRLDAGMETWVAPGVNNWNRVYPANDLTLPNIQGFVRDGQRWGATGMLNTSWDDDGEGLFNQTWYGVLFGAAAGWQRGESSIAEFERSFGKVFHGDETGKIDEAQRKLTAAHARLRQAGSGDASDFLFWLDPWSTEGQVVSKVVLPVARDVRILAESALVLAADARRSARVRETDALDAMELGARRIDFLAAKFQYADEIVQMYARATAADTTREARNEAARELSDITGINGRTQDVRDGFANLKQLYQQAWLRENRPYWIENVLARYDKETQLWIDRMDRFTAARREWNRTRKFPTAASLGVPTPEPQTRAP